MVGAALESEPIPIRHDHAVLLVDDDTHVLSALVRTLSREPYRLLASANPREAIARIRSRPVSLVVSDERMGEMSGSELLEAVRACSPRTLGVILTAFPWSITAPVGHGQLIRWVLAKPWEERTIARTLRHLLREQEMEESAAGGETSGGSRDLGGEA